MMMYEDQYPYLLGPTGGLSSVLFDQDFCLGAKASISSSPVRLPESVDYQGEGSVSEDGISDLKDYDSFNQLDVLFPNITKFGPEDLFGGLPDMEVFGQESVLSPQPDVKTSPKGLTIKVKRVKHPKRSISNLKTNIHSGVSLFVDDCKQSPDIETFQIPRFPTQMDEDMSTAALYPSGMDFEPLFDLASEVCESRLDIKSPSELGELSTRVSEEPWDLPLIEAVKLHTADSFFDSLLVSEETDKNIQPNSSGKHSINSPSSSVPDNWSGASTCGSSPVWTDSDFSDYFTLSPGTIDNWSTEGTLIFTDQALLQGNSSDPSQIIDKDDHGCPEEVKEIIKKRKLSREEKYFRKKRQNREAALRYRQKKKIHEDDVYKYLVVEKKENASLKKDYKNLTREISFIKNLMRETLLVEV